MISEAINTQMTTPPSLPTHALAEKFYVGDWLVFPDLNRLQHRHLSLHRQLEPRLIHLLCYLAANGNRVLSRQELVQELWPRVVVNDNSLTRAVSELRKQLISPEPDSSTCSNYIDTIAKKGYRLLPHITRVPATETADVHTADLADHRTPPQNPPWLKSLLPAAGINKLRQYQIGISALCLSFLITAWITLDFTDSLHSNSSSSLQLSDELLENTAEYYGGEVSLSTMDDLQPITESIAKPVISNDEKQYAYIQYDNAGSTIFLGGLGTAIEPVPVFNSTRYLFNLAWAPVGNNLLFAMKPAMTTAALYSSKNENAELLMLDLATFKVSRLIQEQIPENSSKKSNLT